MVAEEILITLSGGAPWGFRLQGGAEHKKPLQVAKVRRRSKACRAGLRESDELLSINEKSCGGLSHAQAMNLIDGGPGTLHICVKRAPSGFQSVVLLTRSPSPRIDKEYRAAVREVHRGALMSPTSRQEWVTSPPDSEAYYGETDSDADTVHERQRRQKRRSPSGSPAKIGGRASPEETSEMSGYESAPDAQVYPTSSPPQQSSPPGVARREVIYQPPPDSENSPENSSSSADDQSPLDGQRSNEVDSGFQEPPCLPPLVSPERAKEARLLASRGQLVPMVGPVDNPVAEELTVTYMDKAKQAKLHRGESVQDKQVKEARTKCRSIAALLTDSPNPHSKGVLMFKKRRQRAKKFTLTCFGSVEGGRRRGGEDEEDEDEEGIFPGSESELDEDGFTSAPESAWDSDYLEILERKTPTESPGLSATSGKGAQLFEQQRKREEERVAVAAAVAACAEVPPSQSPMSTAPAAPIEPTVPATPATPAIPTGPTAPAMPPVSYSTMNGDSIVVSRATVVMSSPVVNGVGAGPSVLNRTAQPFAAGFATHRAVTMPVVFRPSVAKKSPPQPAPTAMAPPLSFSPPGVKRAVSTTSLYIPPRPNPRTSLSSVLSPPSSVAASAFSPAYALTTTFSPPPVPTALLHPATTSATSFSPPSVPASFVCNPPAQATPFSPPPVQSTTFHPPPAQATIFSPPPAQAIPFSSPPAQSMPVSSPPVQSIPFSSPPTQSMPFSSAPAQSMPFSPPPVQSMPFSSPPVQSMPFSSPSVQSMPVSSPPVQSMSFSSPPVQSMPFSPPPVQSMPFSSPPVQSMPVSSHPVQSMSFSSPPVQSMPFSPPPVQSMPFSPPPVQSMPVSSPPVQSMPFSPPPVQSMPVSSPPVQSMPFPPPPVQSMTFPPPSAQATPYSPAPKSATLLSPPPPVAVYSPSQPSPAVIPLPQTPKVSFSPYVTVATTTPSPPAPATPTPAIMQYPTSATNSAEALASREQRISVPASRTGILQDARRRSTRKPMFCPPEEKKNNSPNPELLSLVQNLDERPRPGAEGFESGPEEDFLNLGAEACNFMQAQKVKLPPPVAPKPHAAPEGPQIPQMGGKGAELFARRQSRMDRYVVDRAAPAAPPASTGQPRLPSPTPSLPCHWKYSSSIRAPPPINYNPLLSPSCPPGAQRGKRVSEAARAGKKTGAQKQTVNSLDFMNRQPYQLNSAMFSYGGGMADQSSSLTAPKQIPVKAARVFNIKRFSTPTPMSAPASLAPAVIAPRSATTLGEPMWRPDVASPPPAPTGALPELPKIYTAPVPNPVPIPAPFPTTGLAYAPLQNARQWFKSAPELSPLPPTPLRSAMSGSSSAIRVPRPRFSASTMGIQANVWRPGSVHY